eukprot:5827550-Pyramimonas_sp.AAC.1
MKQTEPIEHYGTSRRERGQGLHNMLSHQNNMSALAPCRVARGIPWAEFHMWPRPKEHRILRSASPGVILKHTNFAECVNSAKGYIREPRGRHEGGMRKPRGSCEGAMRDT